MKAKHTAGPWELKEWDNERITIWGPSFLLAIVNVYEENPREGIANAHLTAAAPDLLKAAKWGASSNHHPNCKSRKTGMGCDCHVGACQRAIAKAEGQEGSPTDGPDGKIWEE